MFFKPFGAETIKLNPNRLLKPVQIWLACWACCLSYSWGNSGTALRKQGSRDADKQTKDEQEALLFFLPLACTWNKLYVCNRVSVKQYCFWHIVDRKTLNMCSMTSINPYAEEKEHFCLLAMHLWLSKGNAVLTIAQIGSLGKFAFVLPKGTSRTRK